MKFIIILNSFITLSLSLNTYASDSQSEKMPAKKYELSIGYLTNQIKYENSSQNQFNGSGFGSSIGRIFNLSKNINTTSSAVLNCLSLSHKGTEDKLSNFEFGFAQKISYDFLLDATILRPFIAVGVTRGSIASRLVSDEDSLSHEIKYNKYGGAVGLQVIFNNSIVPFVMYDMSALRTDSTIHTTEVSKGVRTLSSSDIDKSYRKLNSGSLSLGAGFLF